MRTRNRFRIFAIAGLLLISLPLLIFNFSSCGKTFDGYSYSIDDARGGEKCYEAYDCIFTAEQNNTVVDFLINKNVLYVVKIDAKDGGSNAKYKVSSVASYSIDESLYDSEVRGEYYWVQTGKTPIQVEWLVVNKEFNDAHEKYNGFDFIYKEKECVLCYKIIE